MQETTPYHELFAGYDQLFIYVLDECLDERSANFFYPFLQPYIIVQKFPFAGQNSKIDRKIEIIAVNYLDEAIFDFLGELEDTRQV